MNKVPIEPTKYRYSCVECGFSYAAPRNEELCDDCIAKEQAELKAGKAIPISAAMRLLLKYKYQEEVWMRLNEYRRAESYKDAIIKLEDVIREYESRDTGRGDTTGDGTIR